MADVCSSLASDICQKHVVGNANWFDGVIIADKTERCLFVVSCLHNGCFASCYGCYTKALIFSVFL